MKLFQTKSPELSITFIRAIPGLMVGLAYAFSLYGLMYYIREIFRLLSVSWDYHIWELSREETYFYNFFYAGIAVLFGQMKCFELWFSRPRRPFGAPKYRRLQAVNDSRISMWYFMSWFSKLAVVYGIYFGVAERGGYNCFGFYPNFQWLFYLILLVLFLSQWSWFLIILKRKALKWMIVSLVITLTVSIGLSRVNLSDYKRINSNYAKYNLERRFQLDYPVSEVFTFRYRWSLTENVYVGFKRGTLKPKEPAIIVDTYEIPLKKLDSVFNKWVYERDISDRRFMSLVLHIDQGIPLSLVKEIESKVANAGILKVKYRVKSGGDSDCYNFGPLVFAKTLHKYVKGAPPGLVLFIESVYNKDKVIQIDYTENKQIFIDGEVMGKDAFGLGLKRILSDSPEYSILYFPSEELDFGEYFDVLKNIHLSIEQLRDVYSLKTFGVSFDELIIKEQWDQAHRRYPKLILEPNDINAQPTGHETSSKAEIPTSKF